MLNCNKENNNAKQSLIFFPFAGGSGEFYIPWFKYFDQDIACYYALLNGRGKYLGYPNIDNLPSLIDLYIPEILKLSNKPFSLFGHSMGGLVAFELSRKLYFEHNILPQEIFISGFRAPCLPCISNLMHKMSKEEVFRKLQDMQALTLSGVNIDIMEPFWPAIYSDFKICELYKYTKTTPLPCNITVLWGKDDHLIQQENICLWQDESCNKVSFYSFKGGHFYLEHEFLNIISIILNKIK
ncbi:thioesterase II family protein [Rickettsia tamurae]|uniref:Linear gramicidin dehydrogenase LgrE n=1 Tax=Rickettsia tamurae subsp. buchneri TaxID=1462938 RepID=A0A8E0WN10_9RICK|nr:thioesterase domain-containing protein [Rickettsia tamurae]KDO03573.1 Linear gramicidin dehydrogenase LgrE [Rickettsia tamurae subsp. buchneri]